MMYEMEIVYLDCIKAYSINVYCGPMQYLSVYNSHQVQPCTKKMKKGEEKVFFPRKHFLGKKEKVFFPRKLFLPHW